MNSLSSQYVSDDFKESGESFGRTDIGDIDNDALLDYLVKFANLAVSADAEYAPNLKVTSLGGIYRVERSTEVLYVSDINDPNLTNIEASPDEAFTIITGIDSKTKVDLNERHSERSVLKAYIVPIALLVIILGIGAAVGNRLLKTEDPLYPEVDIPRINDRVRIGEMEEQFTGIYITGRIAGDRIIALSKNGRVEFFEFAESPVDEKLKVVRNATRSYNFAEESNRLYSIADGVHVISLLHAGEIEYYEDRYKRFPGSIDALLREK